MHLSTLAIQLLFAAQLPVCLYVGQRTARHTGRSRLAWLVWGFLLAVIFPPLGAIAALVAFWVCPPQRDADRRPRPAAAELDAGASDTAAASDAPATGEPSSNGTAA